MCIKSVASRQICPDSYRSSRIAREHNFTEYAGAVSYRSRICKRLVRENEDFDGFVHCDYGKTEAVGMRSNPLFTIQDEVYGFTQSESEASCLSILANIQSTIPSFGKSDIDAAIGYFRCIRASGRIFELTEVSGHTFTSHYPPLD